MPLFASWHERLEVCLSYAYIRCFNSKKHLMFFSKDFLLPKNKTMIVLQLNFHCQEIITIKNALHTLKNIIKCTLQYFRPFDFNCRTLQFTNNCRWSCSLNWVARLAFTILTGCWFCIGVGWQVGLDF